MHLDPQSSYIYNIPASLLMGGFLLAVCRTYQGELPGLRLWAMALLVRSLGMLLTALHGQIASLLSLLLGSALVQLSLALYYLAMLDFLGRPERPRWPFGLIALGTLAQAHAVLVQHDLDLKIALYALCSLPLLGATTHLLLWRQRPGTLSQTLTGLVFLGTLPVGVLRSVYYGLRLGQAGQDPFHENLVQDISYLSSYLSALLATFGFLMMCSDRYRAERRQAESTVQHLACHDPLTDLPNRRLLHERLPQAIEDWRQHGRPLAVFMIDLDRFKNVNDELGHAAGDELLRQVAQRLREVLLPADLLARLGGDEFIALVRHTGDTARLSRLAQTLIERLSQPFELGQPEPVRIGASIGIARCPLHGQEAGELLRAADRALYEVKSGGRGSFRHVTDTAPFDAAAPRR